MSLICFGSPLLAALAVVLTVFAFLAGRGRLLFVITCLGLLALVVEVFLLLYAGADLEEVVFFLLCWNAAFFVGGKSARKETSAAREMDDHAAAETA